MVATDVWARFRERILDGTTQVETLKAWRKIAALTELPPNDAFPQLTRMLMEQMDEAAYVIFRNALILVNTVYWERAGLKGIQDPAELQQRYVAYMNGPDVEARQYDNYFQIRAKADELRKPKEQAAPYSAEELEFARQCNEMYNGLALALNRANPAGASPVLIQQLNHQIALHEAALANAKPEIRTRRQAVEAIAQATYAIARVHLILKQYPDAQRHFQSALDQFEALNDTWAARSCRVQLASLSHLQGNLDAAMKANLEVLTARKDQARDSPLRAEALVNQMKQTLNAGDQFEARNLLTSAVTALNGQGYPDPGKVGVDAALALWIEAVPPDRQGIQYAEELAKVMQLYASIASARARLDGDAQAEEQVRTMLRYAVQMQRESLTADADLQKRFTAANARPLLAPDAAAAAV